MDEADCDAAGLHQHAGEDEQRDRQQHERIHRLVDLLHDDDERKLAAPDEPGEPRCADRERHRHAEDEQHQEHQDRDRDHGCFAPCSFPKSPRQVRHATGRL